MNDEAARQGRPANDLSRRSEITTRSGLPRLILELPIEGRARLRIDADSYEDEIRFRLWLRRALARRESFSQSLGDWLNLVELEDVA